MNEENLFIIGAIIGIILLSSVVLAAVYGWVNNLVQFIRADFQPSYKEEIIRGVGVVISPIGVIVGYVDFDD